MPLTTLDGERRLRVLRVSSSFGRGVQARAGGIPAHFQSVFQTSS